VLDSTGVGPMGRVMGLAARVVSWSLLDGLGRGLGRRWLCASVGLLPAERSGGLGIADSPSVRLRDVSGDNHEYAQPE
jgi:hypothetical protein